MLYRYHKTKVGNNWSIMIWWNHIGTYVTNDGLMWLSNLGNWTSSKLYTISIRISINCHWWSGFRSIMVLLNHFNQNDSTAVSQYALEQAKLLPTKWTIAVLANNLILLFGQFLYRFSFQQHFTLTPKGYRIFIISYNYSIMTIQGSFLKKTNASMSKLKY